MSRYARILPAVLAVGALLTLSGCGQPGLSRQPLQDAVATTFTNLYALRQQQLRRPVPSAAALGATARCDKGGPDVPDVGPGDTWTCLLVWQADGPGTPVGASYEVQLKTDGCYTADGPPSVVGQRLVPVPGGRPAMNPIASFDGCFDAS